MGCCVSATAMSEKQSKQPAQSGQPPAAAAAAAASTDSTDKPAIAKPIELVSLFKDSLPQAKESAQQITEIIFLGGVDASQSSARQLQANGVAFILNVSKELPNVHEDSKLFAYARLPLNDSLSDNLHHYVDEAIAFIDRAHAEKKAVLVHCSMGMSRSASMVMAWLMQRKQMRLRDAYFYVKQRRWCVSPNGSFMRQLVEMERRHFGGESSVDPEDYRLHRLEPPWWPKAMQTDMLSF